MFMFHLIRNSQCLTNSINHQMAETSHYIFIVLGMEQYQIKAQK